MYNVHRNALKIIPGSVKPGCRDYGEVFQPSSSPNGTVKKSKREQGNVTGQKAESEEIRKQTLKRGSEELCSGIGESFQSSSASNGTIKKSGRKQRKKTGQKAESEQCHEQHIIPEMDVDYDDSNVENIINEIGCDEFSFRVNDAFDLLVECMKEPIQSSILSESELEDLLERCWRMVISEYYLQQKIMSPVSEEPGMRGNSESFQSSRKPNGTVQKSEKERGKGKTEQCQKQTIIPVLEEPVQSSGNVESVILSSRLKKLKKEQRKGTGHRAESEENSKQPIKPSIQASSAPTGKVRTSKQNRGKKKEVKATSEEVHKQNEEISQKINLSHAINSESAKLKTDTNKKEETISTSPSLVKKCGILKNGEQSHKVNLSHAINSESAKLKANTKKKEKTISSCASQIKKCSILRTEDVHRKANMKDIKILLNKITKNFEVAEFETDYKKEKTTIIPVLREPGIREDGESIQSSSTSTNGSVEMSEKEQGEGTGQRAETEECQKQTITPVLEEPVQCSGDGESVVQSSSTTNDTVEKSKKEQSKGTEHRAKTEECEKQDAKSGTEKPGCSKNAGSIQSRSTHDGAGRTSKRNRGKKRGQKAEFKVDTKQPIKPSIQASSALTGKVRTSKQNRGKKKELKATSEEVHKQPIKPSYQPSSAPTAKVSKSEQNQDKMKEEKATSEERHKQNEEVSHKVNLSHAINSESAKLQADTHKKEETISSSPSLVEKCGMLKHSDNIIKPNPADHGWILVSCTFEEMVDFDGMVDFDFQKDWGTRAIKSHHAYHNSRKNMWDSAQRNITGVVNLFRRVGFSLFGLPSKRCPLLGGVGDKYTKQSLINFLDLIECGYDAVEHKVIRKIVAKIISESHDEIIYSIIPIQVYLLDENISDRENIIPVFTVKKYYGNLIVIDIEGRVYESWENFLSTNKFPRCRYIYPKNGIYKMDDNKLNLETRESPAHQPNNVSLSEFDQSLNYALYGALAGFKLGRFFPLLFPVSLFVGSVAGVCKAIRFAEKLNDLQSHKVPLSDPEAVKLILDYSGDFAGIAAGGLSRAAASQTASFKTKIAFHALDKAFFTAKVASRVMCVNDMRKSTGADGFKLASYILFNFNACVGVGTLDRYLYRNKLNPKIFENWENYISLFVRDAKDDEIRSLQCLSEDMINEMENCHSNRFNYSSNRLAAVIFSKPTELLESVKKMVNQLIRHRLNYFDLFDLFNILQYTYLLFKQILQTFSEIYNTSSGVASSFKDAFGYSQQPKPIQFLIKVVLESFYHITENITNLLFTYNKWKTCLDSLIEFNLKLSDKSFAGDNIRVSVDPLSKILKNENCKIYKNYEHYWGFNSGSSVQRIPYELLGTNYKPKSEDVTRKTFYNLEYNRIKVILENEREYCIYVRKNDKKKCIEAIVMQTSFEEELLRADPETSKRLLKNIL